MRDTERFVESNEKETMKFDSLFVVWSLRFGLVHVLSESNTILAFFVYYIVANLNFNLLDFSFFYTRVNTRRKFVTYFFLTTRLIRDLKHIYFKLQLPD